MNASEYEIITSEIANSVFAKAEGCAPLEIYVGRKSKWTGQSGFIHQIDVAIEGTTDIIVVECKYWKNRCVKAEHLLTFVARVADIGPKTQKTIHPVFVAAHRFQSGCEKLAAFYGVDLEVISSPAQFAFEYKGMRAVGIESRAGALGVQGLQPTVVGRS